METKKGEAAFGLVTSASLLASRQAHSRRKAWATFFKSKFFVQVNLNLGAGGSFNLNLTSADQAFHPLCRLSLSNGGEADSKVGGSRIETQGVVWAPLPCSV